MKKIIFLLLVLFSISNNFSQNITNTLGTSGLFTIKDGSTNYLTLSQSNGNLSLNRGLVLTNTTSSTVGVVYKGADRFMHNYGIENTFLGIISGNFTMTGGSNTAIGSGSMVFNTTGYSNTAIGRNSLNSNTSGRLNSAMGSYALFFNSSGLHNTAVGYQSLYYNDANYNTSVGSNSMYSNTTGTENTAVGNESLFFNGTGSYNTALGFQTLRWNSSNFNTAVGWYSLYSNISGSENTAIGSNSLSSNNSFGNTAVGYTSLFANTTGAQNTAVGHHSLQINNGNYNTALGYNAGSAVTTGGNLTLIGIDANPTSGTAVDQITLGNGFVQSLRCNVTTITSLSDMRDKKNVTDLSLGLDFISKLKPRQFNWDKREWYDDNISDGSKMKESPTAGFIAQELDDAQTTENAEWLNLVLKDNPDKWEATPGNLLPIMVKAIQELKSEKDIEIAKLTSENDELKKKVEELKTVNDKVAKLEQIVNELTAFKHASLVHIK